jgi:hypothetical protein
LGAFNVGHFYGLKSPPLFSFEYFPFLPVLSFSSYFTIFPPLHFTLLCSSVLPGFCSPKMFSSSSCPKPTVQADQQEEKPPAAFVVLPIFGAHFIPHNWPKLVLGKGRGSAYDGTNLSAAAAVGVS